MAVLSLVCVRHRRTERWRHAPIGAGDIQDDPRHGYFGAVGTTETRILEFFVMGFPVYFQVSSRSKASPPCLLSNVTRPADFPQMCQLAGSPILAAL
jgi:hypothetical protein